MNLPNIKFSDAYVPYKTIESNHDVEDNRVRITGSQIRSWPFSCIGLVTATLNGKQVYATGVLVQSTVVLTCGELIFDTEEATDIHFMPAFDGLSYTKRVSIKKVYVPEEFRNSKEEKFNFALLLLNESLEEYGHMGIASLDTWQSNDYFHMYGYPQDKVQGKESTYEMWGCKARLNFNEDNSSVHRFYPTSGQQGAPIFSIFPGTNNCVLYGIFTSTNVSFSQDTSSLVKNIYNLIGREVLSLNGYNEDLNDEGFQLLLQRNILFEKLQGISLNCENISFETFSLIKNLNLSNLKYFTLKNHYGDKTIEFLCGCSFFRNLKYISLDENCTEKSLDLFLSLDFPELLDLTIKIKSSSEVWKKFSSVKMPNLNNLAIFSADLTDQDLEYIAKADLKNLIKLDLSYNQITGAGLSHFLGKTFNHITRLDLSCNPIHDDGIEIISKLNMPELRFLELMKTNQKTPTGIKALLNMNFPNLEYLELYPHNKASFFLNEKFAKLQIGDLCLIGDEE